MGGKFDILPPRLTEDCRFCLLSDVKDFMVDTHRNTGYKKVLDKINLDYDDGNDGLLPLVGDPQRIRLPFLCEMDTIEYEVIYGFNTTTTDDGNGNQVPIHNQLNMNRQFFATLSVELISVVKRNQRRRGGARVVGGFGVPRQQQQNNHN